MGKIQRQEREALEAKLNPPKFKILNRAHFIAYLFENIGKTYLKTARYNPYHKEQAARAIALLWFYIYYPNDIDTTGIKDLVAYADTLIKQDPTVLSIAPNQFMPLIVRYLYYGDKASFTDLEVVLKAGGRSKVEEAYQYLMLAAPKFSLQRFEGLAAYYQKNHSPFIAHLHLIMLMSYGSITEKKLWYSRTFDAVKMGQQNVFSANLKNQMSPSLHLLKSYLLKLFDKMCGKTMMNHQDPFILFPIDEELAFSVRQMKKYVPF